MNIIIKLADTESKPLDMGFFYILIPILMFVGIIVFVIIKIKKNAYRRSLLEYNDKLQQETGTGSGSKQYANKLLEAINIRRVYSVAELTRLLRTDQENVLRLISVLIQRNHIKNLEFNSTKTALVEPKYKDPSKLPKSKKCLECGVSYFVTDDVVKCPRCGGDLIIM